MAEKKSTARKATAKAKAAAAVAETEENAGSKAIEWEGLKFELPSVLPEATMLDLAMAEISNSQTAMPKLLGRILGEMQFAQVVNKVAHEESVTLANVNELTNLIFEQYGASEGESEASQDS